MSTTTGKLTTTGSRYQEWISVFVTNEIPLVSPLYDFIEITGRGGEAVYMLDVKALTPEQRERLVKHLSAKFGVSEQEVNEQLDSIGCPILTDDIMTSSDMMWFL